MLIIKADGSKWLVKDNDEETPYRWYHAVADRWKRYWHTRDWRRRQREFMKSKTRYYGDGGTIHNTTYLDVETDNLGKVVAVWFRCQPLPFQQSNANPYRAQEMSAMYEGFHTELHGVEVKDITPMDAADRL